MSEALSLDEHPVRGSIIDRSRTTANTAPLSNAAPCEAVRFYGSQLHIALTEAAAYLRSWENTQGYPPTVVALHDEFSWEDSDRDIAWQLTLVLRSGADASW